MKTRITEKCITITCLVDKRLSQAYIMYHVLQNNCTTNNNSQYPDLTKETLITKTTEKHIVGTLYWKINKRWLNYNKYNHAITTNENKTQEMCGNKNGLIFKKET